MQNGYLKSFNGEVLRHCRNVHWFRRLADAWQIIEEWRVSYNMEHPGT